MRGGGGGGREEASHTEYIQCHDGIVGLAGTGTHSRRKL